MTRSEAIHHLYAVFNTHPLYDINLVKLNHILDEVEAHEREACAKFVDDWSYPKECAGCDQPTPQQYAQAIRARGEP
jgi:hypothetical protein